MKELPENIQRRLAKLDALEAGGVDNWEWYGEALKDWRAENEKMEIAESFLDELIEILCCDCRIEQPAGAGAGYSITDTKPALNFILKQVARFESQEIED